MASPQAAGAAALLVSAAKQAGVQHQPAQLRQAINSSARFLDRLRRLRAGQRPDRCRRGLEPAAAEHQDGRRSPRRCRSTRCSAASWRRRASARASTTARASRPGDAYTRHVHLHPHQRRPKAHRTYNLSWVGNDGTFSSARRRSSLPRTGRSTLAGHGQPGHVGRPLGDPNLDDPATPGIDYQTMNVVVAAEQFTAANNYSRDEDRHESAATRRCSYFFDVPAGTPGVQGRLLRPAARRRAPGRPASCASTRTASAIDSNSSTSCYYAGRAGRLVPAVSPISRTTTNPQAGVWEVTVEARRTSDAAQRRSR